jgi:anti-sigma B factor antagonist
MSLLAKVSEQRHEHVSVAILEGEVDSSNTGLLDDRLPAALTNRSHALVVDLSPTTYLDSAGINMPFELAAGLRERQQRLQIIVPPDAPIRRAIGDHRPGRRGADARGPGGGAGRRGLG